MKYFTVLFVLSIFLLTTMVWAQDQPQISVEELLVCTDVQDRQPAGIDTVFEAGVGKLYCFTKLTSTTDTSAVSHVWFFNDEKMADVDLTLKAKSWRTWSSKNILDTWTGDWRVEVHDAVDNVVSSTSFKVQ
ncbi:MAG: DUF2914 domain-containing protein [Caldithrix sp.]|nr:DUF2914 domain-containing protein [Caldithrix sp.]